MDFRSRSEWATSPLGKLTLPGEAKFWLEPQIELAQNFGLNTRQLNAALRLGQRT